MNFKNNHEYAFTGLEAAIVLIAFIVVAAVFGYVVLGSGFLTSQKAQETVHTGISQAMSTVQQSGGISIQANADGTGVQKVEFYLQLAASGTGAEMSAFGYTLSTSKNTTTLTANDVTYTWVKEVAAGNHGPHTGVLAPKEMVMVTIPVPADTQSDLGYGEKFMVEVKPALGASIPVAATVPGALSGNNWYDVV
ncbi:flagellin [Methanoregula sp.]|uniref:flagellin n=1 Tax=Methanoregula sp. TaxID=2052170 RepID=UPI000CC2B303|nr:flagellin [Methanoregula sp.]PKG32886.1 MAG: flagellin [Methanoregula sp.]